MWIGGENVTSSKNGSQLKDKTDQQTNKQKLLFFLVPSFNNKGWQKNLFAYVWVCHWNSLLQCWQFVPVIFFFLTLLEQMRKIEPQNDLASKHNYIIYNMVMHSNKTNPNSWLLPHCHTHTPFPPTSNTLFARKFFTSQIRSVWLPLVLLRLQQYPNDGCWLAHHFSYRENVSYIFCPEHTHTHKHEKML